MNFMWNDYDKLSTQATSLRSLRKVQSSSSNIESLKKGVFPIGRKKRSRICACLLTLHSSFQLEKASVSSKSMGFPTFFGLSGKKFILNIDTLHLLKVLRARGLVKLTLV